MNLFDIDYNALLKLLIPSRLRKAISIAWLKACIAPVVSLYNDLIAFKADKDYELSHNGQVVKLEAVLNDRWDAGMRRINVANGLDLDPEYLFIDAEDKPVYLYLNSETHPVYIYLETETIDGYDFIVQVPAFISFNIAQMKALINKYRLPSKHNYAIELV